MRQTFILLFFIVFTCINSSAQSIDSLFAKRVFLTTHIYRNGLKLSNKKIMSLYKDTWQPRVKYNWGHYMNPVGPVVAVAGIGLAIVALKGVDASTVVDGKRIDYKIRSLPKLLMGLGLTVGGICIIESSNELIEHSADIYNQKVKNSKKTSYIDHIKLGLTDNGLGINISLK